MMICVMIASVPSEPTSSLGQIVADYVLHRLATRANDLSGREYRFQPEDVSLGPFHI